MVCVLEILREPQQSVRHACQARAKEGDRLLSAVEPLGDTFEQFSVSQAFYLLYVLAGDGAWREFRVYSLPLPHDAYRFIVAFGRGRRSCFQVLSMTSQLSTWVGEAV